jgi:hypothetical protein
MKSLNFILQGLVAFTLLALLGGCANIQAPLPPALELPRPPNDLRAVRKGERVYLFWSVPTQTMDHQSVRRPGPTRVCRSLDTPMDSCGTPVGNLPPVPGSGEQKPGMNAARPEATFVDTLPRELEEQNPNQMVMYAVEALNREARSAGLSNRVQVALAPTLPPPGNFAAQVMATGVVLRWSWTPPSASPPQVSYLCRIYRRAIESGSEAKIADLDCGTGEFRDATAEWQKNYAYRVTSVTSVKAASACAAKSSEASSGECTSTASIEGDDSPLQTVFTNDVYPPAVPSGLQAAFSGPGQAAFVDLLWAPDTDADLAGYNVYRREEGGQVAKINPELVKTPAFRDAGVASGKTYWYSVSAVDGRGNESGRSEEASEAVPAQ